MPGPQAPRLLFELMLTVAVDGMRLGLIVMVDVVVNVEEGAMNRVVSLNMAGEDVGL